MYLVLTIFTMDSQRLRWLPATSNMLHAALSSSAVDLCICTGRPEPTSPALTAAASDPAVCAVCDGAISVGVVDELGCANKHAWLTCPRECLLPGLAAVLAFQGCFRGKCWYVFLLGLVPCAVLWLPGAAPLLVLAWRPDSLG